MKYVNFQTFNLEYSNAQISIDIRCLSDELNCTVDSCKGCSAG